MTTKPELLSITGSSLRAIAEIACSFNVCVPEQHWYQWSFEDFTGTVYATPDHCVIFDADNEAITASLSPFANLEWKRDFLFYATQFQGYDMDLEPLFELMQHLIFEGGELGPRLCVNYLRMSAGKMIGDKIHG